MCWAFAGLSSHVSINKEPVVPGHQDRLPEWVAPLRNNSPARLQHLLCKLQQMLEVELEAWPTALDLESNILSSPTSGLGIEIWTALCSTAHAVCHL